jgi:hypothetical protein
MNNKLMALVNICVGVILAITVSLKYFFIGGIRVILDNITIVDNHLSIPEYYLLIGAVKILVATWAFYFVLTLFISISGNFLQQGDNN